MKKLIIFLSLTTAVGFSAFASEQYQITNATGIWKASLGSGVFGYFDLFITSSEDGKSLNVEHCTLDIEFSGKCTKYDDVVGVGTYSEATDSIQVAESNGSATPNYSIAIDSESGDHLNRSWGTQTIRYFKF
jgi:hypothetical protein